MALVDAELTEPYSIFTYRYFLRRWPHLCFLAVDQGPPGATENGDEQAPLPPAPGDPEERIFGAVVGKQEPHASPKGSDQITDRGYVAMLVVARGWRGRGVGRALVTAAVAALRARGADEVVLEAEASNAAALSLYDGLGFLRSKRLHRYYLSNQDAFRLKLLLRSPVGEEGACGEGEDGEGEDNEWEDEEGWEEGMAGLNLEAVGRGWR